MSNSSIDSFKIKAKLLQKAKKKAGVEFPLKDAFAVIAKTAGYSSWKEMKDDYELADLLNPPRWSSMWKIWFSNREEALSHLDIQSHYLIPYRSQFFICDIYYLNALGIEWDDQDLRLVGRDWSAPQDMLAWKRLLQKIKG